MSSETITRNDLKAILDETLPVYDGAHIVNGEVLTNTVASTTKTNVNQLVLEAGTWLIIFQSAISVGSSKQFQSTITYNSADVAGEQGGTSLTGIVRHNLSAIIKFDSQATVYGTMYQNSGSSLSTLMNTMYAIPLVQYPRSSDQVDYIVEQGTSDIWTYRKWASGVSECWGNYTCESKTYSAHNGNGFNPSLPNGLFNSTNDMVVNANGKIDGVGASGVGFTAVNNITQLQVWLENYTASTQSSKTGFMYIHVKGTWQ